MKQPIYTKTVASSEHKSVRDIEMKESQTKRSKQNYLAQIRRRKALSRQQSETELTRFQYYSYCKLHSTNINVPSSIK